MKLNDIPALLVSPPSLAPGPRRSRYLIRGRSLRRLCHKGVVSRFQYPLVVRCSDSILLAMDWLVPINNLKNYHMLLRCQANYWRGRADKPMEGELSNAATSI